MLFYWIIFFVVFFCAFGKSPRERQQRYTFSVILLGIMGCTRAMSVGMDVTSYCITYNDLNTNTFSELAERFEPGFLATMLPLKFLGLQEPMIFVYLCFIVFWACNLRFVNRYSVYAGFAVFLIYAMGYYFEAYNTVRQMLCHAIILCFIPLLEKKKYLRYSIITIIIALLFHKSQVIMLVCLFPFWVSEFFKKDSALYIYLLGSVLLSAFVLPKISGVLTLISLYVSNDTYSGYLMDTTTLGELSLGNLAIHSAFIAIMVFFANKNNCSPLSRNFLVISVLGQVASNLLSPVSWLLARAANSLCYFRIIPITEMYFSKSTKNRWIFRIIVIIYFAFRFYGRLMRDGVGDDGDVVPYISIFSQIFSF